MCCKKIYLLLVFFLSAIAAHAQVNSFDISTPVDIDPVGLNKVLCMKSGNTLLFHFEVGKPVMVRVFDTAHKRLAANEPYTSLLDLSTLRTFIFKGLYDIGGEAVMFIEQQNSGRHSLVRLRFNGDSGRLIEEKTMGKSKSLARPTKFFVMKNKQDESYAILYSKEVPQFRSCDLRVLYYNARHESYKEVPLVFNRKQFDYLDVTSAEALPTGICISLGLSKLEVNGTGMRLENAPVYGHHLGIFFIHKDSIRPAARFVDVTADVFPYYANATYNPFANSINLLLLSYRELVFQYGIELRPTALMGNLFFKVDGDNMATDYTWLTNKMANASLKQQTDTSHFFKGLPLKLLTSASGLSTVVSESFSRYRNVETKARADVFESYFGDICVTQFDDNGRELWGAILPKSQYYKSYRHYYTAYELSKRWQQQEMMTDLPPQVYNRQFVSCNTYSLGSDIYIVYNDYSKNLHNSNEEPGDTVFTFDHTNTCYYKIDKKKVVTKHYMFGAPMAKEYKTSFIEGADFDEERGVYASLIQYKRGVYVSLRMAWSRVGD